jgi:hypothetical protein
MVDSDTRDIKGVALTAILGDVFGIKPLYIHISKQHIKVLLRTPSVQALVIMGQQESRLVYDSLLTKTHVGHALRQADGRHNEVPIVCEVPTSLLA